MKRQLGTFANNQVNRQNSRITATSLMKAEETGQIERLKHGLPVGKPSHIQHDMHRLIGWGHVLGHLIDGSMVRAIGLMEFAESDEEKAALKVQTDRFWAVHHEYGMEEFKAELVEKVQPVSLEGSKHLRIEAFVVSKPGLAAKLYPDFFDLKSDIVDKDGLTDYRVLTQRMELLYPGVFLDKEKDLVVFAHRFFRRSLSHENKLNDYFLQTFDNTAKEFKDVTARLRLDPDLIGHPKSVQSILELEYWHGPKFSDDIESVRTGATEHKADERIRYHEGINKTHFWWKSPESREEVGKDVVYRTFEVEELIENESVGLEGNRFGCRYSHAEFSPAEGAITHFDGAIRAYPSDAYFERIEKQIDRAGKHSEYTKVFRFDKPLPVERWKRLLSDYFRGNPLVPEYLKAEGESSETSNRLPAATVEGHRADEPDGLAAFISIALDQVDQEFKLEAARTRLPTGDVVDTVETGCGAIDAFLRSKVDLSSVTTIGSTDGVLNLARMGFGGAGSFPALIREVVTGVTASLRQDIEQYGLRKASIAISWPLGEMMVTLSIRGEAGLVVQALTKGFTVIDPTKPPSEWIEPLSELIQRLDPRTTPVGELRGVTDGVLEYEHSGEAPFRMLLPDPLMHYLLERDAFSPGAPGSQASP